MTHERSDGLGAYFRNQYTQPISPQGGGASTVAQYAPINGLGAWLGQGGRMFGPNPRFGKHAPIMRDPPRRRAVHGVGACAPCAAAGFGADAAPAPASLFTLKNAVIAAALYGGLYLAFRKEGFARKMMANGRKHRRNGRWSRKHKNSLPDSAFLYVEPGGQAQIEGGKKVTIPRSFRHFPYKNSAGNVDLSHLRNAISRIPQSNIPESLKGPLQAKARSMLASHGGYAKARRRAGGVLKQAA